MSDSLYTALTALPTGLTEANVPAAVELIRYLLKGVAFDACTASNNVQVLCWLGCRAHDICQTILGHINVVDQDPTSEAAFNAFKSYVVLVKPLEDALFHAIPLNTAEIDVVAAELKSKDDIYGPYTKWSTDRKTLREALDKLYVNDLAVPTGIVASETNAARTYDDLSFLELVATRILNKAGELPHEGSFLREPILKVKMKYDKLHRALRTKGGQPEEDDLNLIVRSASVLLGILTSTAPPENAKRHWRIESTWNDAAIILENIWTGIQAVGVLSDALKKKWEEFEVDLFTDNDTPDDLRKLILDLLRNVANINRAFYAQAFTLVLQCLELENKTKKNLPYRREDTQLKVIIQDISVALSAAVVSAKPHLSTLTAERAIRAYSAYSLFQKATASLTGGFEHYKVDANVLMAAKKAIQVAQEEDKITVNNLIERRKEGHFERRAYEVEFTHINVSISQGDKEPRIEREILRQYTVDKNMRLEGILWRMNGRPYSAKGLGEYPRFFIKVDQGGFKPLDRKITIGEVIGETQRHLYIVVDNLPKFMKENGLLADGQDALGNALVLATPKIEQSNSVGDETDPATFDAPPGSQALVGMATSSASSRGRAEPELSAARRLPGPRRGEARRSDDDVEDDEDVYDVATVEDEDEVDLDTPS